MLSKTGMATFPDNNLIAANDGRCSEFPEHESKREIMSSGFTTYTGQPVSSNDQGRCPPVSFKDLSLLQVLQVHSGIIDRVSTHEAV
jgi:hypothetical protein